MPFASAAASISPQEEEAPLLLMVTVVTVVSVRRRCYKRRAEWTVVANIAHRTVRSQARIPPQISAQHSRGTRPDRRDFSRLSSGSLCGIPARVRR